MSIFFPKNEALEELYLKLGSVVKDMVKLFAEMANDTKHIESYATRAAIIESNSDDVAHKIINELQTSFITPYDRDDLYTLVIQLDDIVDEIEEVVQGFALYDISKLRSCVGEFATLYIDASKELDKLLEGCFGKKQKNITSLSKNIIAVHAIEAEGDDLYKQSIKSLFRDEKDPVEIFKWHTMIEHMEQAMDQFDRANNTIEGIKLKSN